MATLASLPTTIMKSFPLELLESGLVLAAMIIAAVAPRAGSRWFRAAERGLGRLARRRGLAIAAVGLLAVLGRAALLPIAPIPEPSVADEFGYLLAADTFASGRVTNPAHPMWVHLESIHILHQPTYTSKYPIAQSLALAAGKVLGGHFWIGVLISTGLMCASICWMLMAYLPPRWALLGGLIAVLRLGLFSYWINSYWGGAVAATGGALVLGALPRIFRLGRAGDSLLMGLGAAILLNSRPYEGALLCLPAAFAMVAWTLGRLRAGDLPTLARVLLPPTLVLGGAAAAMAAYNARVTGDPLRMPYQAYQETYGWGQIFVWQAPKPEPIYRHKEMRDHARWEYLLHLEGRTLAGGTIQQIKKVAAFYLFFIGPALTPPLLLLPRALADRRLRLLTATAGAFFLGLAVDVYFFPHYAGPFTGALFAIWTQSARHLRACRWRGRPWGLFVVRSIPPICVAMLVVATLLAAARVGLGISWPPTWHSVPPSGTPRARLAGRLAREGGRHLVVVRYGPGHERHADYVYNDADIDGARVVWARDMGPELNRPLLDYFRDRRVWLFEPDERPHRLRPMAELPPGTM